MFISVLACEKGCAHKNIAQNMMSCVGGGVLDTPFLRRL